MTLAGTRPILQDELLKYELHHRARIAIKPGITGIFSLSLNWVTYFQVIVEYGFGFTGARKVSIEGDGDLQNLYSRIISARLLLLAVSYLGMNVLAYAKEEKT